VVDTYPIFVALDATALEGGRIYIGAANTDPEQSPINVYWDAALTVLAAQPLLTSGGVIVRDGAPAQVYAALNSYSIRVRDRSGSVVWYKSEAGGTLISTRLSFPIPTGPASIVPGPSNNTRVDLATLKAANTADLTSLYNGSLWTWTLGDFTGQSNDINIVKANSTPLSVGAWVQQRANKVTFRQSGSSAVDRTSEDKAREVLSVKDFGAKGDGLSDDTAAIQAALNSGATAIYFPPGQYLHGALTVSTNYQRLYGSGAKLTRTSTTATISVTARGVHFDQLRIGCQTSGMVGNNVTVTGPDFRAMFCENRDCFGRPYLFSNCGGGIALIGGVAQTTDQGPNGYEVEIFDAVGGENTLYCFASDMITNQHFGGWLYRGEVGSCAMDKCEFGKLTADTGGGVKVDQCRIGGKTDIQSGFVSIDNSDFNDDVQVGTNGQPNIGSIRFGPCTSMKAGKTITIASNVIESIFFLSHLQRAGALISVGNYNNDIYHALLDVSGQINLGAESGSPTKGNATMTAMMSAAGRDRTLRLSFQAGTTTNFGTGNYFTVSAPFISRGVSTAPARATVSGTVNGWTAYLRDGTNQIKFTPASGGNDVSATSPVALGTGTLLEFSITTEQKF